MTKEIDERNPTGAPNGASSRAAPRFEEFPSMTIRDESRQDHSHNKATKVLRIAAMEVSLGAQLYDQYDKLDLAKMDSAFLPVDSIF